MDLPNNEIEQLESYWAGTLAPEAIQSLEDRLQRDTEFARAAAEWQIIYKVFRRAGMPNAEEESVFRQQIVQFRQEMRPDMPVRKNRNLLLIAAASVLTVAGIILAIWLRQRPDSNPPGKANESKVENPIANYLDVYSSPQSNLGGNETSEANGYALYDEKKYEEASPKLRKEFEAGPDKDSALLFYQGITYLHLNQPEYALPIFQQFAQTNYMPTDDSRWFLCLALVQAGKTAEALPILQALPRNKWFGSKANELEEALAKK